MLSAMDGLNVPATAMESMDLKEVVYASLTDRPLSTER